MKVAIVSESPADTAAIHILLEALTNRRIELLRDARLRAGGWPSMLYAIDVELIHLHYRTDAHALIAIADSDDSSVHEEAHDLPGGAVENCRVCRLRARIGSVQAKLRPRHVNYSVDVAIGLAVPALEAWLLCGKNPHASEGRFIRERQAGNSLFPARKQLKRELYGTEFPSLQNATACATREATRLAQNLSLLGDHFPFGFRSFAQMIRTW
jgi:hypothetical protein